MHRMRRAEATPTHPEVARPRTGARPKCAPSAPAEVRPPPPRRLRAALVLAAALLLPAPAAARAVTVYSAASLSSAFPVIDKAPKYNFAGSYQLQLQIERGAPT